MGDASTFEEPFAALILALLILRRNKRTRSKWLQVLRLAMEN
jgi:hypothetical protein